VTRPAPTCPPVAETRVKAQEGAKGTRKGRTSARRGLGRMVQDGANRILGLANVIYVDDPHTLKLFTDCLPRGAGGTGREVREESGPSPPK
ncbi:MAG: hypothetical protein QME96_14745, partial [Myxococcota bacterium]|nr:hypothetical protein [Myxococcota bacterium]